MPPPTRKSPISALTEAQTALRLADKLIDQINQETAKKLHIEEQRRNLRLLQKETRR